MIKKIKNMLIAFCLIFCLAGFASCTKSAEYSEECEDFSYEITVDKHTIWGKKGAVTLDIKLTALKDIDVDFGSSSYVEEMIVRVLLYNEEQEKYLYNSFYGIMFNEMNYTMQIKEGDIKERTETFSRFPLTNVYDKKETPVKPRGKYKVMLSTWDNNNFHHIDTGIIISAK